MLSSTPVNILTNHRHDWLLLCTGLLDTLLDAISKRCIHFLPLWQFALVGPTDFYNFNGTSHLCTLPNSQISIRIQFAACFLYEVFIQTSPLKSPISGTNTYRSTHYIPRKHVFNQPIPLSVLLERSNAHSGIPSARPMAGALRQTSWMNELTHTCPRRQGLHPQENTQGSAGGFKGRQGSGHLNSSGPGQRPRGGAASGRGGRRARGGACADSPATAGAGRGRSRSRPLPGPHSLVPLQEAALRDGPHGRPRGLGIRRGAEAQAQLLLQAGSQRREAVATRVCPRSSLRARVTVLLVLDTPCRLLELIEILPVPVRRHRARCRRAPRPGQTATPCRFKTTPRGAAHSRPSPLSSSSWVNKTQADFKVFTSWVFWKTLTELSHFLCSWSFRNSFPQRPRLKVGKKKTSLNLLSGFCPMEAFLTLSLDWQELLGIVYVAPKFIPQIHFSHVQSTCLLYNYVSGYAQST